MMFLCFEISISMAVLLVYQWYVVSGGTAVASGWGTTESESAQNQDNPLSFVLKKVSLPLISPQQCAKILPVDFQHICAGNLTFGGMDACRGDSGGPLVCENKFMRGSGSGSAAAAAGHCSTRLLGFANTSSCNKGRPESVMIDHRDHKAGNAHQSPLSILTVADVGNSSTNVLPYNDILQEFALNGRHLDHDPNDPYRGFDNDCRQMSGINSRQGAPSLKLIQ
ncbi:unnamed protein product [Notodromas monacha]|uniref:Peptidase S1 domain-containing protein n=1 Tax=Notodromas monacha TaxID=399045 RepID=A0A7R9BK06_9CRUS|nr:unnamed protein product [Notodromas monacha]CAG0916113.1 unnamed protein product [Notodromas monacha]